MRFKFNNIKIDLNIFDSYHRGLIKDAIRYKIGLRDFWLQSIPSICKQILGKKTNPIVVDVGANIGAISLPLASEYPQATIIAIDAHPVPSASLFNHIKINKLHNITLVMAAISSKSGMVKIYDCPTNSGGHRLAGFKGRSDLSEEHIYSVSVESVTLLEVFKQHNICVCDLLKIDTEGNEYDVLLSLGELLHPPVNGQGVANIIAEYGAEGMRAAGTSPQELWNFMDERGYACEIIQSGKKISTEDEIPVLADFHVVDFLFTPKDVAIA